MRAVLEVHGLEFGYYHQPLLRDVTLAVYRGEVVMLTGSNGAGKSTLIKLALGLLPPWRGEIRLFGEDLHRFRQWSRLGYLPQGTNNGFFTSFPASVAEVVGANLLSSGWRLWRGRAAAERVQQALTAVGLEALAPRSVGSLSGGQQRRVLLARALVNAPELLFLDEPLAGVDAEAAHRIAELLLRLNREGMTIVLASHGNGTLEEAASRIFRLERGRLELRKIGHGRAEAGN
ncbi:MAG: ATP-binding cassette domain-containing protein [Clostridia bacterium]|nr:ATP-binding cassette domain-containing protein [Clostridia bacterium]